MRQKPDRGTTAQPKLTAVSSELQTAGFTLARNIVNAESRALLLRLTTPAIGFGAVQHRGGGAFAARGLLRKVAELPCVAGAGDVLILRPLLLHRSSPSRGEGQRRVLHVVYGTQELT